MTRKNRTSFMDVSLAKNLSDFVSLSWKLENLNCHNVYGINDSAILNMH